MFDHRQSGQDLAILLGERKRLPLMKTAMGLRGITAADMNQVTIAILDGAYNSTADPFTDRK
ncbi:Uncharacterised protein [Vibrio cholerae]|nr:Uncharacterised protein [Vibrio cholerae]CSB98100.1 Uncharacterised protein [Vibrio cholerae]CSC42239.1 Uncharacterised protein [Vibrio cholerae]CSC58878.1 Uncharacterised protein [Vibrio cholerae]